jgi:hydroxyacylglutathione hydrolase
MRVETIPVLGDNYTFLIIDEETRQAAIVDAAELDPVVKRIDALGVEPVLILCTHHHWDHIGANEELVGRYGVPVCAHSSDAARILAFSKGLEEGDRISIGKLEAEVLLVPGHTSGHVAYVLPGAVFTGDCLFAGGCGRLFEGSPAAMHESLNVKLAALPDDTEVYCGHEYTQSNLAFALSVEPGNAALQQRVQEVKARRSRAAADWHDATADEMTVPSTIGLEKATNPFMRVDSPEIIASVRRQSPEISDAPVSILGAVRSMKDSF